MKLTLNMTIIICLVFSNMLFYADESEAAITRFIEQQNRERALRSLERLEEQIDIRIQDAELRRQELEGELDEYGVPIDQPAFIMQRDRGEPARFGQFYGWKIKPEFRYFFSRNSNFFELRNDAVPELQAGYFMTLKAFKNFAAWNYNAQYELGYLEHDRFPKNDHFDQTLKQTISRKGSKLAMLFENTSSWTYARSDSPEDKPSRNKQNNFTALLEYKAAPRITLIPFYSNSYRSFYSDIEKQGNVLEHIYGGTVEYEVNSRMDVFFDYSHTNYSVLKPNEPSDVYGNTFLLGFTNDITNKISLSFDAGIVHLNFENVEFENETHLIMDAFLRYAYSPKTIFTAAFSRSVVSEGVTQTANSPTNYFTEIGVEYALSKKMKIIGSQSWRFQQAKKLSSASPLDNSTILNTLKDETNLWRTKAVFQYRPIRNLIIALRYTFFKVESKLHSGDRIQHTSSVDVSYKF